MNGGALAGKTAVITGAGTGIGRAIALAFAAQGANVVAVGRTQHTLREVVATLSATGGVGITVVADITSSTDVTALERAVATRFGGCDIVVNNAGDLIRKPFAELTDADWRKVMAVTLDGAFYVTRAFVGDIVERRGRIINIASIAGREGTPLLSAYCAAKHGLVGLTRALAEELRGSGVAVNAICPGSVDTAMLPRGLPGASPLMQPEDIASTALFLAAQAPAALTGACLDVFG